MNDLSHEGFMSDCATGLLCGSRNLNSAEGMGDLERTSLQLEFLCLAQVLILDIHCMGSLASLSRSRAMLLTSVQVTSLFSSLGMKA